MRILTLDAAINCGFCYDPPGAKPGDPPIIGEKAFNRGGESLQSIDEAPEIFGVAVTWLATFLAEQAAAGEPIERVALESPAGFGQMQGGTTAITTTVLVGLWGTLAGVARARRCQVRTRAVSTIRKHFIGHGRMPGAEAKRAVQGVCTRLKWDWIGPDGADAAALWHFEKFLVDRTSVAPLPMRAGALL